MTAPERGRSPRRWPALLVSGLVLVLFVLLGRPYLAEFPRLLSVDALSLALLAVVQLGGRLLAAESTRVAFAALGHPLAFRETVALTWVRESAGLALPRSGFGVVGLYLWRRHGARPTTLAALLMSLVIAQVGLIGCLGLAGEAVLLAVSPRAFSRPISLLFAAAAGGAACAVLLPLPGGSHRLWRALADAHDSWRRVFRQRRHGARLLALLTGVLAARVAGLWLALRGIDAAARPLGLALASFSGDLLSFVSLTPQGLGFREFAVVYGLRVAGTAPAVALAAALLYRLVAVSILIVGVPIATRHLLPGGALRGWKGERPGAPARGGESE